MRADLQRALVACVSYCSCFTRPDPKTYDKQITFACDNISSAGKYPLDAVRTVASICRAAEAVFDHSSHYEYLMDAAFEAMAQTGVRGFESWWLHVFCVAW